MAISKVCIRLRRFRRQSAERLIFASKNYVSFSKSDITNLAEKDYKHTRFVEIKNELASLNSQLCKNIQTLNYLASLEFDSEFVKETPQLNEMQSLKKELKLEIVNAMEKIKYYAH